MSGVRFFAVCLALWVVAVLLAAVLFDLALLHGKVDGLRAATAVPSPTLSMEADSEWDFGPPALVSLAPPLFPPLIIEKTVVVETPAKEIVVEKVPSAPKRPWWCGPVAGLGFAPGVCREAEIPSGPGAWFPVPVLSTPIKADEAGPAPAVGLPRVTIEKAPDDTPPESVK